MQLPLRFSWGTTRLVVLVGPVVIKVARIRLFRMIRRLVEHWVNCKVRVRLHAFAENPFIAGLKYICAGTIANWSEYRLWQDSPQSFFVPTIWSFGGIVNLQKRGASVSQAELNTSHPFKERLATMPEDLLRDLTKAANFCRYEERICLFDYGGKETFAYFYRPKPRKEIVVA